MNSKLGSLLCAVSLVGTMATATGALAQENPSLSLAGVPGLIDMPSGQSLRDGTFTASFSRLGPIARTTLSFQLAPRISGSFRYTGIGNWDAVDDPLNGLARTNYDRSFDLRFLLLKEGKRAPAVTLGLQDVIGTGLMSGEYLAATKGFGPKLRVTAGLGWGRLGNANPIGAPFGPRPAIDFGLGGAPRLGQWFKGDMTPFAGVEWRVSDRLGLKAEYSSDGYVAETIGHAVFKRKSPFNFGVEYKASDFLNLGAYYMYGSELGFSVQIVLDPRKRPRQGAIAAGPRPIAARPSASWPAGWVTDTATTLALRKDLQKRLSPDGLVIEAFAVTKTSVQLRLRNTQLDNSAQVLGRAARAMAAVMPPSVETFEIIPVFESLPLSQVTVQRRDLERLEFATGQDQQLRSSVEISTIAGDLPAGAVLGAGLYPKFSWNLRPYLRASVFDPTNPYRADLGLRLSGRYDIAPGLSLSGAIGQRLIGNLDSSTRVSNSTRQHVRSDGNIYDAKGQPAIEELQLAYFAKPAPNLFTRVSAGYLERMFGGVSAEVLWKRVDSPFAIGAELNYVKQRDFDQLFGFQSYSVVTGHVSGYYAFGNGYLAQLDVGRYLAGDVGATLSLDREFGNGWKIGTFATLTDMTFAEFGEGSFDKGIKIEIPVAWILGHPTRKSYKNILRPLSRDGGARLDVDGRLYEPVREYQTGRLDAEWGKFWQ